MPPKGKKGGQAEKGRGAEEEIEEPLQAVVRTPVANIQRLPYGS